MLDTRIVDRKSSFSIIIIITVVIPNHHGYSSSGIEKDHLNIRNEHGSQNLSNFNTRAISPTGKFGRHFAVALGKRTPTSASTTSTPHVIALVGLPARGKTYISKKLSRYLNWIGVDTKVYNLGDYRRKLSHYNSHEIFDNKNEAGLRLRSKICEDSVQDAINWLETEGGEVAVIDATNTTISRRKFLYEKIVIEKGFKLYFLWSPFVMTKKIINANIRTVKISSPDYVHFSEDQVVEDFRKRIKHYECIYETIDEEMEPNLSFMKIFNAGEKVLVHKHEGHIQSRVVYYLMNIKNNTSHHLSHETW
ncbi:6-phosphofructo-2-kinase/fructose-2,6-bisphosphatase 2,6-phosphofructo-2-kinase/fructose-2,6-bisphosphatase 4,6-phosphofructo-2-kinase/fructose-2,6-bisphosphatase 1,6-phosphofructo-2-kinase/fructose-2,6-bisphosphatase,6-phosphofructo-2-kinase/fructose-2,6-bisphosphatase 3 [Lepeophtheirus salmonis]|uniref:6-phosphofructo-2-kinase domain-containing protein n=1 Tax=Lepeophtheirus salmonis TaxID=72036 RepID=A0A7R8H1E7_LEPSM|nr:6-phosphofructo-2-kinase/fructose-2,6-bisphosphatase 2,6-phosphofructo-2-kinase/fructose-2,6-bisphosphatase 4,6-phosphofructo-2-kinase/fructose-2,6-bisphosphatase 1,6-phosphofructo-2-kinase/fructose-2,6-bisphosphatase,6-phosphofructo-2-kinase/fructose-2,6-bisphosphatase 3 [Lepeophtheirus salmonis]CAF2810107.1 6-phosphofructo-2-kinase/fructose-2,6-bisphosphatase 2,6-phosphofructo-2-kinase/fructose-2,6-bisphosphatase 4,6-phosphofructo-2-kinase/fructose-2,6-bisphosphatase 1,6-phosphofructo-2-kinas